MDNIDLIILISLGIEGLGCLWILKFMGALPSFKKPKLDMVK